MQFFILEKINLQGKYIPSPSPKFTGFPIIITLQQLDSLALRKLKIVLANLTDIPSGKCPIIFFFFTSTAYSFSGLFGSR